MTKAPRKYFSAPSEFFISRNKNLKIALGRCELRMSWSIQSAVVWSLIKNLLSSREHFCSSSLELSFINLPLTKKVHRGKLKSAFNLIPWKHYLNSSHLKSSFDRSVRRYFFRQGIFEMENEEFSIFTSQLFQWKILLVVVVKMKFGRDVRLERRSKRFVQLKNDFDNDGNSKGLLIKWRQNEKFNFC